MEWHGGDVTGMLPYSRLVAPPGDVTAEEPTEILQIAREDIPALIQHCPELTAKFVHIMVDRARQFTSADLQNEKSGRSASSPPAWRTSSTIRPPRSCAAPMDSRTTDRRRDGVARVRRRRAHAGQHRRWRARGRSAWRLGRRTGDPRSRARIERTHRRMARGHDTDPLRPTRSWIRRLPKTRSTLAAAIGGDSLQLVLQVLIAECSAHQLVKEIQAPRRASTNWSPR